MSHRWQFLLPGVLAAAAACGAGQTGSTGSTGPPYLVSSTVLRDGTSQEISVWAPVGKGAWPVVYALPGVSGHKSDFDLLGRALARQGLLVFATDYRTHGTLENLGDDVACGYRYIRRVAGDHGGDLRKPVTGVGYSFGALWMLAGALHRAPAGAGAGCAQKQPLPDVVVGVNGCYYEWEGRPQPFTVEGLDRREARVVLVAASADRTCPAWESKKAASALRAAGFHPKLTTISGANHYTPLFHDLVGGKWVSVPQDPAGEQTVRTILDVVKAG